MKQESKKISHWWLIIVLLLTIITIVLALILMSFNWATMSGNFDWSLSLNLGGDLWTMLTALGTIGATLVAMILAIRAWVKEKDATARFISTWISDEYHPRVDGISYKRHVTLHVANESNEPVFDAMVNVHIGRDGIPLGPLAAPAPISVIPPRRELSFDISVPLLAHIDSWTPKSTLTFTDLKGQNWFRELNGNLQDVSGKSHRWSKRAGHGDDRQLGNVGSPFNPLSVALMFIGGLQDSATKVEELFILLSPEAPGWAQVNWEELRGELANFQPTTMVDYPAARIARVKLSGDPALLGKSVEGHGKPLELDNYMFMTLTLHPQIGWRIFGIGENVPPDKIYFGGSLLEDIEPRQSYPVMDSEESV